MTPEEIQQRIVTALEDAKALDIRAIDVRNITDVTDYMVIASGTSSRHVKSVADKVASILRDAGCKAIGREGEDLAEWVLVDFGDVILHVMQPATRDLYQLEKLWEHGAGADKASSTAKSRT
ncbi:MAG: ribosome silencing factor [Acidiferrobacterales bacterium]|jgi:ribosome-associated protein|nr:ribosome silencing factor [Acidiferrobacterales bacterium]